MRLYRFLYLLASVTAGQCASSGERVGRGQSVVNCSAFVTLQDCHDALPAAGGVMRLAPNTVSVLPSTLRITKNSVFILGAGIGSSVVQRSPVLTSGDLITVWGTGFRISGVTLDGNHVTNFTEELGLLGANPIIDSIEIKNNANIGVAVATSGAKILNSHIVGLASPTVGSMGIWFDSSQVERLLIAHNVIQNQRLNGIFGSGRAVEITRNYLSGNHRQVFPSGGGQIAIKGVPTNANISIVGNVIENGGGAVTSGIEIDGPPVQVIWNTVRWNALLGIILQSGFGHQVVGNAVSNSGSAFARQPGILVVAGISGFRILGNRAYDDQTDKTQSHGIQVETGPSSDYVIAGNDVRGNALPSGISDEGWGPNRLVFGNIEGP